ncbi:hypothetical protein [Sporosalibacterium faouarense]|uniref:hypothetical protein n=1 Tax=Sporosalibacterium faouarense TaxID=516123 RepID=UPI00141C0768|nr:hypothetical protein [Sporosalibacterium faouarense]MTI47301.1 hypothetical protein [Bacillota bacterium]
MTDGEYCNHRCHNKCCKGDELLCIAIPVPITVVILGFELNVDIPCIRITAPDDMSSDQANDLMNSLNGILSNLTTIVSNE